MNKINNALVVAILLTGPIAVASAQQATGSTAAHKVALIDVNKVFKDYKKVDALRENIKAEITKSEQQLDARRKRVQVVQGKLKAPNIEPGSTKAVALEKELAQLTSDYEALRKVERQKIIRLEASLLKTVHAEILTVVKRAADAWGYTLVLRFNSDKSTSADPKALVARLNRQVVYHRADDDITQPVIDYLNKQYSAQVKRPATKTGTQPAGATKKRPN